MGRLAVNNAKIKLAFTLSKFLYVTVLKLSGFSRGACPFHYDLSSFLMASSLETFVLANILWMGKTFQMKISIEM